MFITLPTLYHTDLFDEAQEWVLEKMEKDIQPKFLCSSDGQKYLEALVDRDITRRRKNRYDKINNTIILVVTIFSPGVGRQKFVYILYIYTCSKVLICLTFIIL